MGYIKTSLFQPYFTALHCLFLNCKKKCAKLCAKTAEKTDYIVFTLKMESIPKIKTFGLKLMVKSGLEIFF